MRLESLLTFPITSCNLQSPSLLLLAEGRKGKREFVVERAAPCKEHVAIFLHPAMGYMITGSLLGLSAFLAVNGGRGMLPDSFLARLLPFQRVVHVLTHCPDIRALAAWKSKKFMEPASVGQAVREAPDQHHAATTFASGNMAPRQRWTQKAWLS